MNDSVFSKTIQNNRKGIGVRLATNKGTRNGLAFSVNFKGSKYISDIYH